MDFDKPEVYGDTSIADGLVIVAIFITIILASAMCQLTDTSDF